MSSKLKLFFLVSFGLIAWSVSIGFLSFENYMYSEAKLSKWSQGSEVEIHETMLYALTDADLAEDEKKRLIASFIDLQKARHEFDTSAQEIRTAWRNVLFVMLLFNIGLAYSYMRR